MSAEATKPARQLEPLEERRSTGASAKFAPGFRLRSLQSTADAWRCDCPSSQLNQQQTSCPTCSSSATRWQPAGPKFASRFPVVTAVAGSGPDSPHRTTRNQSTSQSTRSNHLQSASSDDSERDLRRTSRQQSGSNRYRHRQSRSLRLKRTRGRLAKPLAGNRWTDHQSRNRAAIQSLG